MLDARLHRNQHLREPLILDALPLRLPLIRRRGRLLRLLRRDRVFELLHPLLHRDLLLRQLLNLRRRLLGHREQVLVCLLLSDELLDDLIHIRHARRLLDLAEGRLVARDLLLLLLNVRLGDRVLRALRLTARVHARRRHRLAPQLLPLLEVGVDLLLALHERSPLGELLQKLRERERREREGEWVSE